MVLKSLHSLRDRASRFLHNHINFIQLHYIYIALIVAIFSALYYCQPGTTWNFIDAFYMGATGATNTGTNSIALSAMSTYQLVVLLLSSMFGSHIAVSLVVVMVRKHYFTKRFQEIVLYNKARKQQEVQDRRQPAIDSGTTLGNESTKDAYPKLNQKSSNPVGSSGGKVIVPLTMHLENHHAHHIEQLQNHHLSKDIVDMDSCDTAAGGNSIIFADNIIQQREYARQQLEAQRKLEERGEKLDDLEYWSISRSLDNDLHDSRTHSMDMYSLAHDQEFTKEQRRLIGGVEYQALDLLTTVIPIYYIVIILSSTLIFRIYIACSSYAQNVLLTTNGTQGSINPWFMSFFITLSAMNNLGLSPIDSSMIPFQTSSCPLILCGFLVLAGNTAYPIFLRFTLWCLYHTTPRSHSMRRETVRYLLDHPRRCYTTLFPARQTWWLLVILIAINLTEIIVYVATNYWLPVMDGVSLGTQLLDALFQAIATRNAGFSVVNLGSLNPGTILVYIVAMYIGVYPVAISMRNSNVYQERSLGMYRTDAHDDGSTDGGILFKLRSQRTINSMVTTSRKIFTQPDFFVMTQIQRQLTKEICWLVIGIFCVCVMEAQSIMSPSPVTIATVIFECVSAFGCVGGSFGGTAPGTSQSADYQPISKLVIILLMYRGRHRGLPAGIDRAVLLPSEQLERSDTEEQHLYKLHRSPSCVTTAFNQHQHTGTIKVYQRSETF